MPVPGGGAGAPPVPGRAWLLVTGVVVGYGGMGPGGVLYGGGGSGAVPTGNGAVPYDSELELAGSAALELLTPVPTGDG